MMVLFTGGITVCAVQSSQRPGVCYMNMALKEPLLLER